MNLQSLPAGAYIWKAAEPNQLTHIKEVLAVNNWASNNWLNYTCLLIMKVIYIESDKYAK